MRAIGTSLGKALGRIAYWCTWPGLFVVLNNSERTRAIIACGDEILVVRGWLNDGKWSLPGGGLHKGEAIRRGCLREIHEETGITLHDNQLRFVGQTSTTGRRITILIHVYVAELTEKPPLTRQRHEIAELAWADWHILHSDNASKDVLDALRSWLARR